MYIIIYMHTLHMNIIYIYIYAIYIYTIQWYSGTVYSYTIYNSYIIPYIVHTTSVVIGQWKKWHHTMDQQARSDIYICIYIYSIYWSGVDVDTSCVVWFWEFQQRMLQLYKMSRGYHQPTYLWDNPQHHLLFSCPNSKPYAIHQKKWDVLGVAQPPTSLEWESSPNDGGGWVCP